MKRIRSRVVRRIAQVSLVVVAGCALGTAAWAQTAVATVPVEKALSDSTIVHIKLPDSNTFGTSFRASQFGRMMADPAFKPLLDDFQTRLEEGNEEVRGKLGMSLEEIVTLPEGPVDIAIVPTPGKAYPVGGLVVAEAGPNEAKMLDLMKKLTELASADSDYKVTTVEFEGKSIVSIDKTADEEPMIGAWTHEGSVFYIAVGTDIDALKDLLANADGRERSLAALESYQAVKSKLGSSPELCWFLNIDQAFDVIAQLVEQQGSANVDTINAQLELTGLTGLKAAGGTVDVGDAPFDTKSEAFLYAPGDAQGLLRLFSMPKADLKPQDWVPATVSSYQSISWDLDAMYTAVSELAETFAPGVLAAFEQQLAGPDESGLMFQRDLFGPLGDRITIISDFKKPVTEDSQRTLVGIEVDDQATFQKSLNKIFELAGAEPTTRDFQGTEIYDLELPEMPDAEGANLPESMSMTLAKGQLLITNDVSLLEMVLRGGSPALADSEAYLAVAKQLPAEASSISFQRPEEQARILYDMIKNGQLEEAFKQGAENAGGDVNVEVPELIDPSKMPAFDVISKYLAPSGGYMQIEPDGVRFTQFSLAR